MKQLQSSILFYLFQNQDRLKNWLVTMIKNYAKPNIQYYFNYQNIQIPNLTFFQQNAQKNLFIQQQTSQAPTYLYQLHQYTQDDQQEPYTDQSFYFNQFYYELLLRFVYSASNSSGDLNYRQKCKALLDNDFILKLIQLFNLPDTRERDYVKTIIHRIYANFMAYRVYIRQQLRQMLLLGCTNYKVMSYQYDYLSNIQLFQGLSDILEILGSIINGYAVPLKSEHVEFLQTCLLPLQAVQNIRIILPQISYCFAKFIEKEPSTCDSIIRQIILCFPVIDTGKQVLILTELDELLDVFTQKQDNKLQQTTVDLLMQTISQQLTSTSFQVAEKAISMLQQKNILSILKKEDHRTEHLQQIFTALIANKSHWHSNIRYISQQTLSIVQQSDESIQYLQQGPVMLKNQVKHQIKQEINEAVQMITCQMALKKIKENQQYQQYMQKRIISNNLNKLILPESQIITGEKILFASVAYDSFLDMQSILVLKTLQTNQDQLLGAIDGIINLPVDDEKSSIQQLIEKDKKIDFIKFDKIAEQATEQLLQTGIGKIQIDDQDSYSVEQGGNEIMQGGNGKQEITISSNQILRNRRASAGVCNPIGIRRKSIVPLNPKLQQQQNDINNWKKHKIE